MPGSTTTPDHAHAERTVLLAVVSLSSFVTPFLGSSLNLAIPAIGRDLHAGVVALNFVATAYLVASAACLLPFGRLSDLLGRRRLFLVGTLGQSAFLLAAAASSTIEVLVALRLLQGIAGAMVFATAMAMLVDAFPPVERGRVLGISTAAVYVGLSVGPVLGGVITQHLGWRAIFLLNGALSLVLAALVAARLRTGGRAASPGRFDAAGAVLYAGSLAATMGGLSTLRSHPAARWVLVAGLVGLAGFGARQLRAAEPLLDLRLFASPVFAFSNLAALLNYSATFAVTFLLSLYLQVVRGLEAQVAGVVLLAQPIMMALLSPVAGRLSDRVEPRRVSSLGMALTAAALALFAFLGEATPLAVVVGELVLIGVGFALFSSPNSNAVMGAVERRDYGVATATLGTMRLVGQALSMATVALIFAVFLGNAPVTVEAAPGLLAANRVAFALFAGLCAVGVFASLARGRIHGGTPR
ncbi:MAG: MFS transporter [Acidobacteria bacterium]|nr:MFS transporter [Acidobacteriota bacterium]